MGSDNKSSKKSLSQLKTSTFERSLSLSKLGLKVGLNLLQNKIKENIAKTPSASSTQSSSVFLQDQARLITETLGELKGSLLKAGQLLSIYGEHFLPPEANLILKELQSQSKPVSWSVIKSQIESELNETLTDQLHIEHDPLGVASMGQVHLAVIKKTQQKIVLKVQYPNLDKAIDSDLAVLKKMLSLLNFLPQDLDTAPLFSEISHRLKLELDYSREAEMMMRYEKLIQNDARFKVPHVFEEFSTSKILATEYIDGFRADHPLIQHLKKENKEKLNSAFVDLYMKEIFEWNLIQTDPHFGNYLIRQQTHPEFPYQLVLLDFGACYEFEDSFIQIYREFLSSIFEAHPEKIYKSCVKLGFLKEDDPDSLKKEFVEFCLKAAEPFNLKTGYQWGTTELPDQLIKMAFNFRKYPLRTPPQELIFIDRKTAGVFIWLKALKSELNPRLIIDPYLKKV